MTVFYSAEGYMFDYKYYLIVLKLKLNSHFGSILFVIFA